MLRRAGGYGVFNVGRGAVLTQNQLGRGVRTAACGYSGGGYHRSGRGDGGLFDFFLIQG